MAESLVLCTMLAGMVSTRIMAWDGVWDELSMGLEYCTWNGSILFANHKANGVVTNIGLSR